nr:hypothetical protein [Mycoplasmopsis bovis]
MNELFAFETNLENDPSVSYSLIGSHAHSTKEYHFYLTKYVNNAKDSKISFIVHNQKTINKKYWSRFSVFFVYLYFSYVFIYIK